MKGEEGKQAVKILGRGSNSFYRPEERHHPEFKDDMKWAYFEEISKRRPAWRVWLTIS